MVYFDLEKLTPNSSCRWISLRSLPGYAVNGGFFLDSVSLRRKYNLVYLVYLDGSDRADPGGSRQIDYSQRRAGRGHLYHGAGIKRGLLHGILGFSLGWYGEGTALGFLASLASAVIVLLLYRVRALSANCLNASGGRGHSLQ